MNGTDVLVLPTCVGMVRFRFGGLGEKPSSPHVRGDGPLLYVFPGSGNPFSPRAWGWSGEASRSYAVSAVLPTCVGMVQRIGGDGSL